MATAKQRAEREQRERARVYEARTRLHEKVAKRRRRDNLAAGIVTGVVVLGAVVGQAVFYTVGPGQAPDTAVTPEPVPGPTSTPTTVPTPSSAPAETSAPSP
ncbi:dioxygenase [Microbacterium sp. G2-8]|uniref:dioxygenase n=1 Tax=Microbacterium sp. G2-8 TaxID=2842454 RepID=UPI001C89940C|nr:dioxygenase [Microbacterium sp. G2-8]